MMSTKRIKLMSPQCKSRTTAADATTDWEKCFICQLQTSEPLKNPMGVHRKDVVTGACFDQFVTNLNKFREINEMPVALNIGRLDNGGGIAQTLKDKNAKWHRSCQLKFSNLKLIRKLDSSSGEINEPEDTTTFKFTRHSQASSHDVQRPALCFFCDKPGILHEASTFSLDHRVRKAALDLEDEQLLAKLSSGDMIAIEAKYHATCLASLYNKAASRNKGEMQSDTSDQISHGIAFAELIEYIDETRQIESVAPVFKLSDLKSLYSNRLNHFGIESDPHSTRLKNRILAHYPDMQENKAGRDVVLSFKKDIATTLFREACSEDFDEDGQILAKAAKIVRRDIFEKKSHFNGSFDADCQLKAVPQSLLSMVSMIQNGPNIVNQSRNSLQSTLTIAQLLVNNSYIRRRRHTTRSRANKAKETPLSVFL